MNAGTKHQRTDEDITELAASTSDELDITTHTSPPNTDWLSDPSHTALIPQRHRRVDVSIDTKTLLSQGVAVRHDEEGTKPPGTFRHGLSRTKT